MYFTRQGYAMNGLINLKYLSSNFENSFLIQYKSYYIDCKIPVNFTFLYNVIAPFLNDAYFYID